MTIDWTKSPPDAEAAHAESAHQLPAWYKREASGRVLVICPAAGTHQWTEMGGRIDFPHGVEFRPMNPRRDVAADNECSHAKWDSSGCMKCGAKADDVTREELRNDWGSLVTPSDFAEQIDRVTFIMGCEFKKTNNPEHNVLNLAELCRTIAAHRAAVAIEMQGLRSDVRSAEAAHDALMKVMEMAQPVFDAATRQSEDSSWDGEGLPPVGTVCIFNSSKVWDEQWHPLLPLNEDIEVTIVAHCLQPVSGITAAVFTFQVEGGVQCEMGVDAMFSPIRTAEQIAAEEREAKIKELSDISGLTVDAYRSVFEKIIEAGYRKQVQP